MTITRRVFRPDPPSDHIDRWVWRARSGIRVHFTDGTHKKSIYSTIEQLIATEGAIEVTEPPKPHHHHCSCGRVESCPLPRASCTAAKRRCAECCYQLTLRLRAAGTFGY